MEASRAAVGASLVVVVVVDRTDSEGSITSTALTNLACLAASDSSPT